MRFGFLQNGLTLKDLQGVEKKQKRLGYLGRLLRSSLGTLGTDGN